VSSGSRSIKDQRKVDVTKESIFWTLRSKFLALARVCPCYTGRSDLPRLKTSEIRSHNGGIHGPGCLVGTFARVDHDEIVFFLVSL